MTEGVSRRGFIVGGLVAAPATRLGVAGATAPATSADETASSAAESGATFFLQTREAVPPTDLLGRIAGISASAKGVLAAAHDRGLAILDSGTWHAVSEDPTYGCAWSGERAYALTTRSILEIVRSQGRWTVETGALPRGVDGNQALLAATGARVVVAARARLYVRRGRGWSTIRPPGPVTALALGADDTTAVVVDRSVHVHEAGRWRRLATRQVTHIAYDRAGRLWAASETGLTVGDTTYRPADGLPLLGFTAIATGGDDGWLGTERGALRFDGTTWEYRQGRRWLPHDAVRAITVDGQGRAFFATDEGLGAIARERTTLAAKAERYEAMIDARHRRTEYGFVEAAHLARPGDLEEWTLHPSDNDGLWTGMYGAAECFRYAATGDPEAKRRARAVFDALTFLGEVTQAGSNPAPPGFVARSILETSATDPNLVDSPERDRQKRAERDAYWKIIVPRWPTSGDGRWYWKSDTSSDELDGHYFFHALYHDLVAESAAEKAEAAAAITRITDHLVSHGYSLVDHDGEHTRWGFFQPGELNGNPWRREERGLNSQSMLAYLTIAEHVASDAGPYARAKKELIERHGYDINTLHPKVTSGVGGGNQSDDEMAFMNFYHLLKYETDPELRQIYARSLHDYWQLEQFELNPFFNFVAAVSLQDTAWRDAFGEVPLDVPADGPWREQSIDTLRRFPLDLVDWKQTNSHRLDIVPLPRHVRPDDEPGTVGLRTNGLVLPVDERVVAHWNTDPYELDQGGEGLRELDGTSFLLPYWLGRYHGLID